MPLRRYLARLSSVLLSTLLVAAAVHAAPPQNADFSGAWRLDDRNSDTLDTLTSSMRAEARKEQEATTQQAPASSSSSATPASSHSGGGKHGGGGGGGMGGGGGGGMGHGGGKHGGGNSDSKPASTDKDPLATATYPMPPLLSVDSVLLVQQDAKTFQVHLNNGDQLTGKLDGQPHQTLNGNAMVRGHVEGGQLIVSIAYADGTQLVQNWVMSPDGQQLVVSGSWKVPTLAEPVSFKRTYVGLH